MRAAVEWIIAMATRVHEFVVANPDPQPGYTQTVQSLAAQLERGEALAREERVARVAAEAATEARDGVQEELRRTLLRPLAGIARATFRDQPELVHRFRLAAQSDKRLGSFLAESRAVRAEAEAARERLLAQGMPEGMLADLAAGIERFESLTEEQSRATRTRIGARVDLEDLGKELMGIVRHLDAINRYRFRSQPEKLAAWRSARTVRRTRSREGEAAAGPAAKDGPAAPPAA